MFEPRHHNPNIQRIVCFVWFAVVKQGCNFYCPLGSLFWQWQNHTITDACEVISVNGSYQSTASNALSTIINGNQKWVVWVGGGGWGEWVVMVVGARVGWMDGGGGVDGGGGGWMGGWWWLWLWGWWGVGGWGWMVVVDGGGGGGVGCWCLGVCVCVWGGRGGGR